VIREIVAVLEESRKNAAGFIIPRKENGAVADLNNTPIMTLVKLVSLAFSSGLELTFASIKTCMMPTPLKQLSLLKRRCLIEGRRCLLRPSQLKNCQHRLEGQEKK
jgi:hypothetical protein